MALGRRRMEKGNRVDVGMGRGVDGVALAMDVVLWLDGA